MATLTYITNSSELDKTLNSILEDVINRVSETLLEDFQIHLMNTVYEPPEKDYVRYYERGGFLGGWEIDRLSKLARSLVFNSQNLIHPKNDSINIYDETGLAHGGDFPGDHDYRNDMPWILNDITSNDYYSHAGGALYLHHTNIGYWDSYMSVVDDRITKWLDEEFKKYGISRKG